MSDEDGPRSTLAQGIGKGLAGIKSSMDELDKEIEQENPEEPKTGKEALFGGREKAIQDAALREFEEEEEAPPIPEPVLLTAEDFERSIWKVEIEKSGNWFSGNYVPSQLTIAFSTEDDGKCEFAGDPLTKGRWYLDSSCIYFERAPLGAMGVFSPFGKDNFRLSLTGWVSDSLQFQVGGFVGSYSALFPTALMGRALMTKVAKITEEEARQRILLSAAQVDRSDMDAAAALPQSEGGTQAQKRVNIIDLSDDLTEEERLKKEAAEWMPSTIVSGPKPDFTKTLERLKGTVGEVAKNYMDDL